VNAWSEIAAMLTPFAVYAWVKTSTTLEFPVSLFVIVSITTAAWIAVTLLTKPSATDTLRAFYTRVHPGGWWGPVSASLPGVRPDSGYGRLLVDWLAGVVLVYAVLFGIGKILLGSPGEGALFLAVGGAAGALLVVHISKYGWSAEDS
jgi:SSS family solute:Na+ symporter